MKKSLILVILIFISFSIFGQEGIFAGLGAEINGNSREGVAAGVGLNFGYDLNNSMALGVKAIYSNDFDTVQAIEPLAFFRYYLPLPVKGLFAQADAGAVILFEDNDIYPAFSGGGTVGWRFELKNKIYLEPYVRGGYPFAFGVGVNVGYKFIRRVKSTEDTFRINR